MSKNLPYFGPWTTALHEESYLGLSAFWKQRLTRLGELSRRPRLRWYAGLGTAALIGLLFAIPSLRLDRITAASFPTGSISDIKTKDDAVVFLRNVEIQIKGYCPPNKKAAHEKTITLLNAAIAALEGKAEFKTPERITEESKQDRRRFMGIWKFRVNENKRDCLAVFSGDHDCLTVYVPSDAADVEVGEWWCNGKGLYQQNISDVTINDEFQWFPPQLFEITSETPNAIELAQLCPGVEKSRPTYTLSRLN